MLGLSLLWLVVGILLGLLGSVAALAPASWRLASWRGRRVLAGVGALAGLAGGWAGALILGSIFGTPSAVLLAILAVVLVPHLLAALQRRTASNHSGSARA